LQNKIKIGVYQLTGSLDFQVNLDKIRIAAQKCNDSNADYLFLPECFYSMGNTKEITPYVVELDGEHYNNIKNIAKDFNINILAGSAATKVSGEIVNRAYNFSSEGEDLGFYDKRNLFACDLGKGKSVCEADLYKSGNDAKLIELDSFKIGLGICFDVRFSKTNSEYREMGANVLTYSSAFTVPTGKAHWHTLLRARAIESQCFVIAPAQWGKHNDTVETYGHSLVVDPWGEVILDLENGEKLGFCELDFSLVDKVRGRIPLDT
jgi:predicted amidohydrolase